jgi:hypothetical protein
MANEIQEGEGFGKDPAAPGTETGTEEIQDEARVHEEEAAEGEAESFSTGATWVNDAIEWLSTTVRERPLETLLIVAGASLVTGVLTGTLLKTTSKE